MSAVRVHVIVTCPDCSGAGEHSYEPHDWWHGSGVNVQTWTCGTCRGLGECSSEQAEEWRREYGPCGKPGHTREDRYRDSEDEGCVACNRERIAAAPPLPAGVIDPWGPEPF